MLRNDSCEILSAHSSTILQLSGISQNGWFHHVPNWPFFFQKKKNGVISFPSSLVSSVPERARVLQLRCRACLASLAGVAHVCRSLLCGAAVSDVRFLRTMLAAPHIAQRLVPPRAVTEKAAGAPAAAPAPPALSAPTRVASPLSSATPLSSQPSGPARADVLETSTRLRLALAPRCDCCLRFASASGLTTPLPPLSSLSLVSPSADQGATRGATACRTAPTTTWCSCARCATRPATAKPAACARRPPGRTTSVSATTLSRSTSRCLSRARSPEATAASRSR